MCMLISDQMPDLSRFQKPEQKIDALYQYIFSLKQQINHALSNIGEDNLNKELTSTLKDIQNAVTAAVQGTQLPAEEKPNQWPVGAVYLTGDAAHEPAKLFGGKWEQRTSPIEGVTAWQRKE